MFFGGDQFKNNLGNNVIIKCHECGDTNLRYVDSSRTGTPGSGYICGNGHETWGAIDDWDVHGQTDTFASRIRDCCCEGTSCEFPDQIYVNFDGIEGVQAREACTHLVNDELAARGWLPISPPCAPRCTASRDGVNGPWSVSCGCEEVSGPCQQSTEAFPLPAKRRYTQTLPDLADPNKQTVSIAEYVVRADIPAERIGQGASNDVFDGVWTLVTNTDVAGMDFGVDCCNIDLRSRPITPGFFEGGYPDAWRTEGPAFFVEIPTSIGDIWSSIGGNSILFYLQKLAKIQYIREDEESDWVCDCVSYKIIISVIKRKHPSTTPKDDPPAIEFVVANEGIADPEVTFFCGSCGYTEPDFNPGWDPINERQFPDATDFCDLSNLDLPCVNCVGDISANNCKDDNFATFWPYRIPTKYSASLNPTPGSPFGRQYFLRNKNDMEDVPLPGDCDCSQDGLENDTNPDFCYETVDYPKCLEVGTTKCFDEDAKYRIPCEDPGDSFIVRAKSNVDDSVLSYRYDIGDIEEYRGFSTLENIYIIFEPIFNKGDSNYDYWQYPPHPNPVCEWAAKPGLIPRKGDPRNTVGFYWYEGQGTFIPTPMTDTSGRSVVPYTFEEEKGQDLTGHTYGAVGVSRAHLGVLLGDSRFKFEQPHCTRRVKNPDLDSLGIPFYMVYTGDLSKQTIVLDRYYPTGDPHDFLWKGQRLSDDLGDGGFPPAPTVSADPEATPEPTPEPTATPVPTTDQDPTPTPIEEVGPSDPDTNVDKQAFIKYRGDIALTDDSAYPYPFIAKSGSLEEPEIVAIIHSASGTGGQIAFQTFPASYDSDILVDPYYYKNSEFIEIGLCKYKTRVTVYGYGVMYPLIDDPIWSETTTPIPPAEYDPGNPPVPPRKYFEYPVLIPGENYQIGDKIEFRCWKTLEDSITRFDELLGNPIPAGQDESIWREECVETIIATATITELNDERLAPTGVAQTVPDGSISVDVVFNSGVRYYETYKLKEVTIAHTGTGYSVGETIDIEFEDTDAFGPIVYDVQPSVSVTETGVDGRIEAISIKESGSFYKIVRTGGIRWYEFDVEDAQENPLITIGNCPCSYDVCTDKSDCNGCASKNAYPSGHNKLNSSPFNLAESITAKEIRSYFGEPWYKPFNPEDDPPDAEGCITDDSVRGDSGRGSDQLIPLYCPPDSNQTGYCNESCDGRIPCDKNCTCSDEDCVCTKQQTYAFGLTFISGWFPRNDYDYCWPLNNTWEFPNFTENYGLSACSGDPVVSGFRPYLDGDTIIPHKRPQYEYVWQPNTTAFTESIESIIELNPLENKGKAYVNSIKDEYLSIEGCNPLRVDRFGKSYKFIDPTGERTYPTNPCRKTNSGDPIPSGAIRTSDDYCRVYGFYQQRQPDCEILYRGQYIMRAAEKYGFGQNPNYPAFSCPSPDNPYPLYVEGHTWTDCEPIIGDINIRLKQIESQFDISVGAPYSQDYLIPENLPLPYVGPDGKYESTADAWNEPSLSKTNNTRFFDHGFYEPNRYAKYEDKQLPENESEEIGDREQILSPVFLVNPVFSMPDVDGKDYPASIQDGVLVDLYNPGVWDLPDPRSNCRPGVSGISCGDECDNPTYGPNVNLPAIGTRNDLRSECPYPWERWGNDQSNTNDIDYYCMLKNNSAEIVIDEIVECEDCFSNDIVRIDYIQNLNNTQYPALFWYSYAIEVPSEEEPAPEPTPEPSSSSPGTSAPADDETTPGPRYILFRLYGNFGEINDLSVIEAFHNVINEYISILGDRYKLSDILSILLNDTHRSILWNMVFEGASNEQLESLTKVEVFAFESVSAESWVGSILKLFSEYRCEVQGTTGSIKSLKVQSGGSGYAFEIEERVAPTGFVSFVEEPGSMEIETFPASIDRRRETYYLSDIDISVSGILSESYATKNEQNQWVLKPEFASSGIPLTFTDTDARRDGIVYIQEPRVNIQIDPENREIIYSEIEQQGEFYKYVGTGQHRAFPVAMILNNYWDNPDGTQNFGRHAKLRPVVGVDPSDLLTYGKIKRIEVDFGGIDYVTPGKYWQIETTTAEYDSYGNPLKGLDIQHLVDPCKYRIETSGGLSTDQISEYRDWYEGQLLLPTVNTPSIASYWKSYPNSQGDPFTTSTKHYVKVEPNKNPITWSSRAESWNNIIESGSCPINSSGNLLDRTYRMALIEENDLWNGFPHYGNCSSSDCNDIIDEENPKCTGYIFSNDPYIPQCGGYCNVFSSYDAHRFSVGHTMIPNTSDSFYDVDADTPPYVPGCYKRIDLKRTNDPTQAKLFCFNIDKTQPGGEITGKGFREYRHLNSSRDHCSDAEYSNYLEFGLYYNDEVSSQTITRSKTISYNMGNGPITMTISYDKEDVSLYSGICPSGSWQDLNAVESGLANLCGCEEKQLGEE